MREADETSAELLKGNSPIVIVLRQYETYFRENLWHAPLPTPVALALGMNAYQIFLAAFRMALSGHPAAVFPLLRTALENAAYSYLIQKNPQLQEIWLQRHQGETQKKACREAFTFKKAISSIEGKAPDIHKLAIDSYESSIDYGAHPNIKGVLSHINFEDQPNDQFIALKHTSLYSSGHIETIRGLCACLDFGLVIIGIISLSLPEPRRSLEGDLNRLNKAKNEATSPYIFNNI